MATRHSILDRWFKLVQGLVVLGSAGAIAWIFTDLRDNRVEIAVERERNDGQEKRLDDLRDKPRAPQWLIEKVGRLEHRGP